MALQPAMSQVLFGLLLPVALTMCLVAMHALERDVMVMSKL
jgi:hypothetical protein